jgi:Flp pilus assembly protein TadG
MTRPPVADDTGSLSVAAALAGVVVIVLLGLVVDGGNVLAARQHASDLAENAARSGANALSIPTLRRTGRIELDPVAAQAAAQQSLRVGGVSGTVSVDTTTVTVTVTIKEHTPLLALTGVDHVDVTGRATADVVLSLSPGGRT